MNIALYQQDIVWLDPDANYTKMEDVLRRNPSIDLLVMPEMCTTGFVTQPESCNIESALDVEQRLLRLARQYNTALAGSFAVQVNGSRPAADIAQAADIARTADAAQTAGSNRNRLYFVTPEGGVYHYDKHHLFTPGQEDKGYQAGGQQTIVEWRGIRFLLAVCYDLRFPVWLRYTDSTPYDILLLVANWPSARQLAWNVLLRARAIENQAYCIGVNRVGHDQMCEYAGGSMAIHPYGHPVTSCEEGQEGLCIFSPDMESLASYRHKFPSLADADRFLLEEK